jgi:hypothetical protein
LAPFLVFFAVFFRPLVAGRVARWFIFKPKIPIWGKFSGPQIEKCWYISWPFGMFYGHMGYCMTIWHSLCLFGTFFRFWYHAPRKIWHLWLPDENVCSTPFMCSNSRCEVTFRTYDLGLIVTATPLSLFLSLSVSLSLFHSPSSLSTSIVDLNNELYVVWCNGKELLSDFACSCSVFLHTYIHTGDQPTHKCSDVLQIVDKNVFQTFLDIVLAQLLRLVIHTYIHTYMKIYIADKTNRTCKLAFDYFCIKVCTNMYIHRVVFLTPRLSIKQNDEALF